MKWLTTEGNYNMYRGGATSHGKGKLYWDNILNKQMKEAGIRKYRSPKAIKNKIMNIEDSFKSAHDWAGQTGAGLKDDNPGQFDDYVRKKCPYYFDLLHIMQDRATSRPQMTSDSLRAGSDEDNDDDDDDDLIDLNNPPQQKRCDDEDSMSSSCQSKITGSNLSFAFHSPPLKKLRTNRQSKKDDPFTPVLNIQMAAIAEAT